MCMSFDLVVKMAVTFDLLKIFVAKFSGFTLNEVQLLFKCQCRHVHVNVHSFSYMYMYLKLQCITPVMKITTYCWRLVFHVCFVLLFFVLFMNVMQNIFLCIFFLVWHTVKQEIFACMKLSRIS